MLRTLLFDFDGTIADTEAIEFRSVADTFERHGATLDPVQWGHVVGTAADGGFWEPWLHAQIGHFDASGARDEVRARKADLLHSLAPRPGVTALLTSAADAGIVLAIASSSPRAWVERHLRHFGLHDHFHSLSTREDVVTAKPAPDLYLHALTATNTDVAHALAVEDSRNGTLAAKSAGLPCVVCPNDVTAHQDHSSADLLVGAFDDLQLADLHTTHLRHHQRTIRPPRRASANTPTTQREARGADE